MKTPEESEPCNAKIILFKVASSTGTGLGLGDADVTIADVVVGD